MAKPSLHSRRSGPLVSVPAVELRVFPRVLGHRHPSGAGGHLCKAQALSQAGSGMWLRAQGLLCSEAAPLASSAPPALPTPLPLVQGSARGAFLHEQDMLTNEF